MANMRKTGNEMSEDSLWCPFARVSHLPYLDGGFNRLQRGDGSVFIPASCSCLEERCGVYDVQKGQCGLKV